MTNPATIVEIADLPGPHGVPVLGNMFDIDLQNPIQSVIKLAKEYGPIFKLSSPNATRIIVSGLDLVNEVCDDARFDKFIAGGLVEMSKGAAGHGLFTTSTEDRRWQRAHAILMAPFSMQAMEAYVPKMQDIADQLISKWERLNPDDAVDLPADMTNLTLDTIALCGFGYRFNSFYRDPPAADQDSVEGARKAPIRRRPSLHGGPGRLDHPRTQTAGPRRRRLRPLGPHAGRPRSPHR
jgi:cytochrome P450/NADPH-cytochrome P450 reductase